MQKAAFHGGHGHDVRSVEVEDTLQVRPSRMNGGVKHEPGDVHAEIGRPGLHYAALHVDLDEAGGRNLVVQHSKGVDEKVFGILTDANLKNKTGSNITNYKNKLSAWFQKFKFASSQQRLNSTFSLQNIKIARLEYLKFERL